MRTCGIAPEAETQSRMRTDEKTQDADPALAAVSHDDLPREKDLVSATRLRLRSRHPE